MNAYRLRTGQMVSYLAASPVRWRSAKITAITDVNNVVLAIVEDDGTRVALNGGVAVARRTGANQTNVWRPY
jgi:hypothetical protein